MILINTKLKTYVYRLTGRKVYTKSGADKALSEEMRELQVRLTRARKFIRNLGKKAKDEISKDGKMHIQTELGIMGAKEEIVLVSNKIKGILNVKKNI
ncbi:hypothetical protein HN924_02505 [Candidatus Woesearchaeota archaeon]|jgi:hypothetical protein|nr:hypothetical protein [Candidatus Woesearchaeota archaeon]MBT7062816.1 hypothetical protein [Candidatus Woesearchaeota archaeon]MBT7402844.1 hypothetical protein [Candidatus Woesearchaeota archaeon]